MKKLAILVLISSFLTFTAAMALAHDGDYNFKNFHGTYEMISSGICLHSTSDWTPTANGWQLKEPTGKVWAGTATARATWIFKPNGTGTVQGTNYAAIFPGSEGVEAPPSYEAISPIKADFTYEITNKGEVTVTGITGGIAGVIMNGMLSIDGNIMTLLSASQRQDFSQWGLGFVIIDNMRILIKVRH